jgi:YesN/AraC family two-component response regulator
MDTKDLEKIKSICKDVNILCVEDDFELRNQLVVLLSNFFNNIYIAEDGVEAIKVYRENNSDFELILTDINMPNMNGVDLIKLIKEEKPEQKIVVLSAHDNEEYIEELKALNINEFLKKPVKLNLFVQIVVKLMVK